ncbi:hypothetical protein REPUB_Repub03eG0167600 [Reevesia pubescens]
MASVLAGDDLARSMSNRSMSRRASLGSGSRRGWASASIREAWNSQTDAFHRSRREEDEEQLKWAAIERLPTYDRLRKGMLKHVLDEGKVGYEEVDITNLDMQDKKNLMGSVLRVVEEDNERFLLRLRERTDRVGIDVPKIEVRFENFFIEGDAYLGTRALPTLLNSTLNTIEGVLGLIKVFPSKKRVVNILRNVSGIVKPSRMTLLLGPPGSGKTTLLQALAGKIDIDLKVSGKITYCGHEFREFFPRMTSAYISQHDLHHGEMTVRETLDFSGRCLGVGTRYEHLAELSRREKQAGIKPDPEIDAFMKATAMAGQKTSLVTDYVLKILGLDICSDIMVGDEMRRGISGGQKKRVTTGEMLVGPAKALFMDEISTGLDSSTTFQIVRFMKQMVHIMDVTMIISLLQPAPETYDLFDDIILLSEGKIVYQGPRENVLEFFESVGFKCPERKGVADFLQEVTSKKDQQQYWCKKNEPYQYISVPEFVKRFKYFHIGQKLDDELRVPYDKSKTHPAALVKEKYGISNWELFKACFARECLINVMFNGMAELALTIFRLPVFFKQRDFLFYPAWAFALPIWVLRIPLSLLESGIWIILTYYTIGFAPAPSRFFRQFLAFFGIHQMALSLFRFIAAVGRTQVVANTLGTFTLLVVFVLGGFIVAKDDIKPWMIWGYYASPMSYGQNAIVITEFLDKRWSAPYPLQFNKSTTVGKILLKSRGMYTEEYWYWICVAALIGFSLLFNLFFIAALTYLNPMGDSKSVILDEDDESKSKKQSSDGQDKLKSIQMSTTSTAPLFEGTDMAVNNTPDNSITSAADQAITKRGMVLPFQPLSLAFDHVNYYVDMPAEMKSQGIEETRLQLLGDFAEIYAKSELYRKNDDLIKELSSPMSGTKDLHFPTTYSRDFFTQCKACFWKQHHSYWRNPQYNAIRFFMTFFVGIIFGMIFWDKGDKIHKQQDLMNLLGAMYSAVLFLGATNTLAVQCVVAIERTVFYRERAAGMYSPLPYAFAQVAIEAIYVSIQTFVYSLLLYSMIGFHMDEIPIWWRWYYWASPVAWTIYGLVTSQVGDKLDMVEIPGELPMTVKAFLETQLGFKYDFLPAVVAAHIVWVLLFLFVFAYGIKFLNFQRR